MEKPILENYYINDCKIAVEDYYNDLEKYNMEQIKFIVQQDQDVTPEMTQKEFDEYLKNHTEPFKIDSVSRVEYLTVQEVIEKHRPYLTDEQINRLK